MATILTSFPNRPVATWEIRQIIASSAVPVEVTVGTDLGDDSQIAFCTRLYPYNGRVSLNDVGSLIAADMRNRSLTRAQYSICFDSATMHIDVFYRDMIAEENPSQFLTSISYRRVFADSVVAVNTYDSSTPFSLRAVVALPDGSSVLDGSMQEPGQGRDSVLLSVADWRDHFAAAPENAEMLTLSVRQGAKNMVLQVVPGLPDLRLCFKNSWNVLEFIDLRGTLTEKTSVSSDSALVLGEYSVYNQRTEKEYEFESEPLTSYEALGIEQIFNSHDVSVLVNGRRKSVLFKDQTCEISNNDDELPSVKFTFRFADATPFANLSLLAQSLRQPAVFSVEFDREFS